ncbi:MAG: flippase-like domain-containing protein [Bacteroidota bacterium]|nr:flippase-like domain-containing protein [Bacteroidota bacterium]
MKKKFLSALKFVFFLGLGLFLVWWQFSKMTATQKYQFGESLKHANYWLLFPIVILALLSHLARAIRWKILIAPMGYRPSTENTFYSLMSGYLVNTFVPRAGEILRCSLLSRYEKIPMNKLIGSVLVERAFDLVCYLFFIAFTILIQIKYVAHFVKGKLSEIFFNEQGTPGWIKVLIFFASVFLIIILLKWIFKKFAHHRYIISLKGFHIGLKEGFNAIARLKNRGWFIFLTFFIWAMYVLEIFVGFSALSATDGLGIVQACSVLSLATLGMIISPGGIGAFPLAVKEVLEIYNINKADSLSFGWIIWGASTAIIIGAGLISFGLLVYKNKKLHEAKQTDFTQNI